MESLKGYKVWKVIYGDGTAEKFKAFTSKESKARQIAAYTALKCNGIKSINITNSN